MAIDLDAIEQRLRDVTDESDRLAIIQQDAPALVAEVRKLRGRIRSVRDEMLREGYHRPNELILIMDDALGEEY